jgi:stage II sporulation protein P
VVLFLFALGKDHQTAGSASIGIAIKNQILTWTRETLLDTYTPVFLFIEEDHVTLSEMMSDIQLAQLLPFYRYAARNTKQTVKMQDAETIERLLFAQAQEEEHSYYEEMDGVEEEDWQNNLLTENTQAGTTVTEDSEHTQTDTNTQTSTWEETIATPFVPRQRVNAIDLSMYTEYESLVKNFYTIDSSTMIGNDQLNVELLSGMDLTFAKDPSKPQILIFHTHYHEMFKDSIPDDPSTSIVGVGEKLATILREDYGYGVIHYTGEYDMQAGPDAYSGALPILEEILKENPSIEVVIDLHRDAAAENDHLMIELDGKPTAQFMFFNGLSRTRKTGNIEYLRNDNLESTLAFSFQLQVKSMEYYPGLTRKIYLKAYRYNMHLSPRSSLIEVGAQNNTVEEAMNACYPLAHILDMVLSGEEIP